MVSSHNPILTLDYIPAFESLGEDYFDPVAAAEFPVHHLRFRNDVLFPSLGLDAGEVTDDMWLEAFGQFRGRSPFLAMRYHGYQFGEYNPHLGDGRGFLYGQVRGTDGRLYDFGTKGSGTTPYSRGGDGRLTLKGGVREVIAAEALQVHGVNTSRCLSLVETGEQLWRGDEPSPTRSSVMVRFSHSHIRFGTFERLHARQRPDRVKSLLDHVIEYYYPHLLGEAEGDRYGKFFAELVQRVAQLVAQWMAAGFCHAVLNTDNMSITGESFDYGPYAFIETFDPRFTAAYFDYSSRYCYGNQPRACFWNLELLQTPLKMVMDAADLEAGLDLYQGCYRQEYSQLMLNRLGFATLTPDLTDDLIQATLRVLHDIEIGYHQFFQALRHHFAPTWQQDASTILVDLLQAGTDEEQGAIDQWRSLYQNALNQHSLEQMEAIAHRLAQHNPDIVPIRAEIEAIWEPIVAEDNWQPFNTLIQKIQTSVQPA
ncbi:MAG: YdiU family protein [Cyanothece sp. SIO2G6]|nr:YdiU family protein [Cyanothece sp. SIO2G6]